MKFICLQLAWEQCFSLKIIGWSAIHNLFCELYDILSIPAEQRCLSYSWRIITKQCSRVSSRLMQHFLGAACIYPILMPVIGPVSYGSRMSAGAYSTLRAIWVPIYCATFQRMPNTSSPLASLPKPIPSTTVPPPLLRSPMGDGNSAPAKKQSLKQDQLTSIDFYNDFSSSIRGQMSKLRDRAKVEAFKEAIDRVKHLVRGKVALKMKAHHITVLKPR